MSQSPPDAASKRPLLTERVDRAMESVLIGEHSYVPGMRDQSLSPTEHELFVQLAEKVRQGDFDADLPLWRLDYTEKPPDIGTFILDDKFLGRTWRPVAGENEGIWPAWLKLFEDNLNINSRIHNMVLTGSLGIGKTVMMVTALLYRICIATYLKNPQHFFGLNRNSNIVYNLLSVTKEAVKDTAFGTALSFMADSPFFLETCGYNPDLEYSGYRVPMLNRLPDGRTSHIWLTAGSKGQHVLGRNLIGIGLDEGNFRLEKDPDITAYELYDNVRTRIANRFQKLASFLPALCVIASSAQDESSFTEKIVSEIDENNRRLDESNAKLPPDVYKEPRSQIVFRNAIYRIKRHALTGIGPDHHWFKVAYGLKNMEPFIMSGWYKEDGTPIGTDAHEDPPNGAKTELVPQFYWEAYKRNCKSQLQNLSGISVGGAHRLFPSLIDIEECLTISAKEGVPNPMQTGIHRIPISSEDNKNIWDYLNHRAFLTRVASRIQPIRHPQNKRYAHIDLATQTMAGLSICHLAGNQLVEGLVKNGEPFSEYRLLVEYDFILTITAGQNKPINFGKIQSFFFWLRDMCGYQFGLITADQFQSVMPLQELEARGFAVDKLSIDRDKSVYNAWRAGFEEHRIRLYRNEQMIREAENLLEVDKKYDHPPDGSKDTCLSPLTKIIDLQGRSLMLGDLKKGEQFWVYGITNGSVQATKATALGITRKNVPVVRVTLDNGKNVTCTPDHLFMLRNGTYKKAELLKAGESLMPFYFKRLKKGYGSVYNPAQNSYRKVYLIVDEQLNGPKPVGYTVHHKNHTKTDDRPENLQRLTNAEHWALHRCITGVDGAETEKTRQERLAEYNAAPSTKAAARLRLAHARKFCDYVALGKANGKTSIERFKSKAYRTKHAQLIKLKIKTDPNYRSAILAGILKSNQDRKINVDFNELQRLREEGFTNYDIADKVGCSVSLIERRVKEAKQHGFEFHVDYTRSRSQRHVNFRTKQVQDVEQLRLSGFSTTRACKKIGVSFVTYKNWLARLNHKVFSVEYAGTEDVTCLRTSTGNFAVEAGVFVHNCDGASGAFFNAVNSDEKLSLASHNAPTLYTGKQMQQFEQEPPPVSIVLPNKAVDRLKVFKA